MPNYDYQCRTCGRTFEWFQSMSAEKLTTCPEEICEQEVKGEGIVERKIGKGAGLIFSGSGFYQTDYTKTPNNTSGTKTSGDPSTPSTSDTSAPAASPTPSSDSTSSTSSDT